MIGGLTALGILSVLFCCGFLGAAIGLRELNSGRPPKLGLSYRVYIVASSLYGVRIERRVLVVRRRRFVYLRAAVARRQAVVASRKPAPRFLELSSPPKEVRYVSAA